MRVLKRFKREHVLKQGFALTDLESLVDLSTNSSLSIVDAFRASSISPSLPLSLFLSIVDALREPVPF